MYGDDIAVLDSQVVTDHAVDSSASIIEIVIGKDDKDGVFSLLALDKHCISSKEL